MLQDFKMLNAAEYPVATIGIDAPEFEEILTGSDLRSIPMQVTLSGITASLVILFLPPPGFKSSRAM